MYHFGVIHVFPGILMASSSMAYSKVEMACALGMQWIPLAMMLWNCDSPRILVLRTCAIQGRKYIIPTTGRSQTNLLLKFELLWEWQHCNDGNCRNCKSYLVQINVCLVTDIYSGWGVVDNWSTIGHCIGERQDHSARQPAGGRVCVELALGLLHGRSNLVELCRCWDYRFGNRNNNSGIHNHNHNKHNKHCINDIYLYIYKLLWMYRWRTPHWMESSGSFWLQLFPWARCRL